jgi:ABC-type multidrug transport system ATPase subunit
MILDEPTLGQDDASVAELVSLISRMAKEGRGFIIISHCEHFIEKLGAERLVLSNGILQRREAVGHV